ncbi:MAG: tail fiber domain-containing protein [Bacteroidales bacterium]|nr:tail fiber domain-containing protein [Bacteroidales bacterium]
MKKLLLILFIITGLEAISQVAINADNSSPDPSAMLDVKSTDKGMLVPRMTSAQRTAISDPAGGLLVFDSDTGSFWFYNSGWIELGGSGTSHWTQNGGDIYYDEGNVGIGDQTPASSFTVGDGDKFQVSGTEGDVIFTDDQASIYFPESSATSKPMMYMFNSGKANSPRMIFSHSPNFENWGLEYEDISDKFHILGNGGRNITLDPMGYIGINNSSPLYNLDISGNLNVTQPAIIDGATVGSGDFRGNYLNGVINCGGGNINYSNILSDTEIPSISFAAGDEDLYIEDDLEVVGTAYKTGGGSWTSLSDERLKKNIQPFTDGLEKVMQINPVSFQYNQLSRLKDQETRYVGILAQDMLSIAPYMVQERAMGQKVMEIENGVDEIIEPGEMVYTFDPSAFDYLLINAIQEQQQIIEELNERIEKLEAMR